MHFRFEIAVLWPRGSNWKLAAMLKKETVTLAHITATASDVDNRKQWKVFCGV
jgi:hypothetical protein